MKRAALALAALLTACGADRGTIAVTVVAAPGSDLLDRVERLRATLSEPHTVFEAERDEGGIALSLEIDAREAIGDVAIEGFDAGGARIAVGRSGPLPLSAADVATAVYLAPPMSMAEAPASLDPPRTAIGAARRGFGAVLAGGRGPDGEVLDTFDVYGLYGHDLAAGTPMPTAAAEPTVVAGTVAVYLFGGTDEDGEAIADLYAFDTATSPTGRYVPLPTDDALARAGASSAALGSELFVIAGDPPLIFDGVRRVLTPVPGAAAAAGQAAPVTTPEGPRVLIAGAGVAPTGAARIGFGSFDSVDAPAELLRVDHAVAPLPGGDAIFVGGAIEDALATSAVVYRARTGAFEVVELLATPRRAPAVAVTGEHLVVAGGADAAGEPVGDVEVFDAETLAPVATVPLVVPRTGAVAVSLGNGQVLVAGGLDAAGEPTGVLELFTPDVAPPR